MNAFSIFSALFLQVNLISNCAQSPVQGQEQFPYSHTLTEDVSGPKSLDVM